MKKVSPYRCILRSSSGSLMYRVLLIFILVFLHVSIMQAWSPPKTFAKEKEEFVGLTFQLPQISNDTGIIRITNSDLEDGDLMYIQNPSLNVIPQADYKNIITTSVIKDQRMVEVEFNEMKKDYAGTYKCHEGFSNKIADCGFQIIVLLKPDTAVIEMSEDSSLLVGQSVNFHCLTKSNSLPSDHGLKLHYVWKDEDGNKYSSSSPRISVLENGTLVLSDLRRTDKGMNFTCKAADDPGKDVKKLYSKMSQPYKVVPQYAPNENDISTSPYFENNTVLIRPEGTKLDLSCSVDCEPSCKVSWKRVPNGSNRYVSLPRTINPKALVIEDVWRNTEGSYICEGENIHGRIFKGFTLDVQYLSTPEVSMSDIQDSMKKVFEGENKEVQLTCLVDSNPLPTIIWKNPNKWLMNQSRFSGPDIRRNQGLLQHLYSSNVTLKNLKCEDGGSYSCHADNALKMRTEGEMEVDVRCQPSAVRRGQYPYIEDNLVLKDEYVFDMSGSVGGTFIVRGWPAPTVKKVRSTLGGSFREETMPKDFAISTEHPFSGKNYLTHFSFQIKRDISLADRGRIYILTMESSDFTKDIQFSIQPRGPPLPVSSLNVTKTTHNSIALSWTPEFNGGETQTFSVFVRVKPKDQSEIDKEPQWTQALSNIADEDQKIEVKVDSLSSGKTYEVMIMALNSRGNATSLTMAETKEAPVSSADAGAIVGAVFAVIIILLIIGGVLFYFFIYKKRWGKNQDGESRIPMIGRMSKIFRGKRNDPNGNVGSGSDKKRKFRPIFKGGTPKPKDKDYANVPTESEDPTCKLSETDDPDLYINTSPATQQKEPVYGNVEALPPANGKGDYPKGDPQDEPADLNYTSIDFKGMPPAKPPRMEPKQEEAASPYVAIDFEKTKANREEMERLKKEEEERKAREEEEEEQYENLPPLGTNV